MAVELVSHGIMITKPWYYGCGVGITWYYDCHNGLEACNFLRVRACNFTCWLWCRRNPTSVLKITACKLRAVLSKHDEVRCQKYSLAWWALKEIIHLKHVRPAITKHHSSRLYGPTIS